MFNRIVKVAMASKVDSTVAKPVPPNDTYVRETPVVQAQPPVATPKRDLGARVDVSGVPEPMPPASATVGQDTVNDAKVKPLEPIDWSERIGDLVRNVGSYSFWKKQLQGK